MASTFLKIQMSRYSPRGKIPPRLMLNFLSGMMESSVISSTTPSPLQVGQAPYGELKEKLLGAGSSYDKPVFGSIKNFEKWCTLPASSKNMMTPLPSFNAVFTDWPMR